MPTLWAMVLPGPIRRPGLSSAWDNLQEIYMREKEVLGWAVSTTIAVLLFVLGGITGHLLNSDGLLTAVWEQRAAELEEEGDSLKTQVGVLRVEANEAYASQFESRAAMQAWAEGELRALQVVYAALDKEHQRLVGLSESACTVGNFFGAAGEQGESLVLPVTVCASNLQVQFLEVQE